MQTGLVINNFVEFADFIEPFYQGYPHLEEFVKFYKQIKEKCKCDEMSMINRAINYYLKLNQILTPEEVSILLHKNNNKPIVFMYQKQIFHQI